jgi:tRNA threonylcarbamoyladenosine modification (KEOPS) complex  Pcc1 subunit
MALPSGARSGPHIATFTIRGDARQIEALRGALAVEADDPLGGARVKVAPGKAAGAFVLEIEADDLAHLRAATNSYLKWLAAAHGAIAAAEDGAATP